MSGSLILGGYDSSRFDKDTSVSFQMPEGWNNTLIVGVQSISTKGEQPTEFLTEGFTRFRIESSVSELILPSEACEAFQSFFGLTWDPTTGYYLLDEDRRTKLLEENPSVVFSILETRNSPSKEYVIPYSAFDLQLQPPLVGNSTYYFPIRRSYLPGIFILGRVFLQETHLMVDYTRKNFSLSQALFTDGPANIVPYVNGTLATDPTSGSSNSNGEGRGTLSVGAYVGIAVGACVLTLLAALLFISWRIGWWPFNRKASDVQGDEEVNDRKFHRESMPELETEEGAIELAERERGELETVEPKHEADDEHAQRVEGLDRVHEMSAENAPRSQRSLEHP